MILYLGNKYEHFFINDVFPNEQVEVIEGILDIKDLINPATSSPYRHIIINISLLINEIEDIVSSLKTIQTVSNANIVLYAPGTPPTSSLIQGLYFAGYKNFIISNNLSDIKEECRRCCTGFYDINPVPFEDQLSSPEEQIKTEREEITIEEIRQAQKRKLTVGVAGCCHRIGTTTQALQICKYLQLQGNEVCFIEANHSQYMLNYVQTLLDESDYTYSKEAGLIRYAGIDIYIKADFIPMIKKKPYDYFIYDFGSYFDESFNEFGFWDKDYNILICGIKPEEADGTTNLLVKTLERNCFYIFSFISPSGNERKDVLDLMEAKAEKTSFGSAVFNPFEYSSHSNETYKPIFSSIIGKKDKQPISKKQKKFLPFRKREKHNT